MWDDVAWWFDPRRWGVLPDGEIVGTTTEDWQRLLDLIGQEAWTSEVIVDGAVRALPDSATALFDIAAEAAATIRVWPAAAMQANVFVHTRARIDFDVDLRELQGQRQLDALCVFVQAVGRAVAKRVELRPEGAPATEAALAYDPDGDCILWLEEQR